MPSSKLYYEMEDPVDGDDIHRLWEKREPQF
jgi:hypothetical protein